MKIDIIKESEKWFELAKFRSNHADKISFQEGMKKALKLLENDEEFETVEFETVEFETVDELESKLNNLEQLDKDIDEMLKNETTESLDFFFKSKRK